ncbi:MAG: carboxypeptidase regulatory-like domain-containing protein [Flavobacteriales bacterium]|nr:carboxypeptidase regulatory-like domain-containing protein [Flavobacteriales bacterium]
MHKIKSFLLFLIVLLGGNAFGQLAELNQQNELIKTQIEQNLMLSKTVENSTPYLLAIARGYYQLDNYTKAEEYFLKVIDNSMCGINDLKALAICLKMNGKQVLADEILGIYLSKREDKTLQNLWDLEHTYNGKNVDIFESKTTNYSLVYGSVSEKQNVNLNINHGTASGIMMCNNFANLKFVELPVSDLLRVGNFTDGPIPNSIIYSYLSDNGYYQLYLAIYKKGKLKKVKQLFAEQEKANYAFPFLYQNQLIFASDKSGGFGGYDLYKSMWTGKTFEYIQSLGEKLNTDKNEIMPSTTNGEFSFASNGFLGQGGYDVFLASSNFDLVTSIPFPFNSTHNEFAILNYETNSGNVIRQINGESNLYKITQNRVFERRLVGRVLDAQIEGIPEARILISQSMKGQGVYTSSDNDGDFWMIIPDTIDTWNIEIIKPNFITKEFTLDLNTLGNNSLIINLDRVMPLEPEPVYIVSSKSENVVPTTPKADTFFDEVTNEIIITNQPRKKDDIFNEVTSSGRYYIIYASSKTYEGAYDFWEEWKKTLPNAEILENPAKGVYRVGTYAGTSHTEAMKEYKRAKNIKADCWILRPDTN